jgi:anhydro-N-acetylmuramic acid kinase
VALQAQILAASYPESSSVDLICHLNVTLGVCFTVAAIAVAQAAGVPLDQIDLIGSHGQTIYHIPEAPTTPPRRPAAGRSWRSLSVEGASTMLH